MDHIDLCVDYHKHRERWGALHTRLKPEIHEEIPMKSFLGGSSVILYLDETEIKINL